MGYSEREIEQAWEHGRANNGLADDEWRQDECGAWLQRKQYNNSASEFGWQIINATPSHTDRQLRPLHIANSYDPAVGKAQCQVVEDRDNIPPTAVVGEPKNHNSG